MGVVLLSVARDLVHARGLSLIAVDHPDRTRYPDDPTKIGKLPVGPWKPYQDRRPTDAELVDWFGGPPANLAIVTGAISGVVVIDGDTPAALAWMAGHLPPTPMRTRTRRGEHWFFRHPGVSISNRTRIRVDDGLLAVDVRGDGGYVIAPPSTHASGAIYARTGSWPSVDQLPTYDPSWLPAPPVVAAPACGIVTDAREVRLRRARAYLARCAGAISGQHGHHDTYRVVCFVTLGFDLTDDDALALLRDWNTRCVPPWSDRELTHKIRSARTRGTGGRAVDRRRTP